MFVSVKDLKDLKAALIVNICFVNFREKDGKLVSKIDSIQSRIRMKTDGSVSILTVVGALESDGGNYSCAVQTEEETQRAYILAAST